MYQAHPGLSGVDRLRDAADRLILRAGRLTSSRSILNSH